MKRKFEFDSDEDDFLIKRYRVATESDSEDSLMGPPSLLRHKRNYFYDCLICFLLRGLH